MTRKLVSILALLFGGLAAVASAGVNTWTTHGPSGADVVALAVDPANPAIVYAGVSRYAGVFRTANGGESWNPINDGFPDPVPTVYDLAMDTSAPSTLYAATILGVFKRASGERWRPISAGLPRTEDQNGTHIYVFALAVHRSAPATIYAGTDRGVSRTTDGGESWNPVNVGLPVAPVDSLAIDPSAPSTLYAGTVFGVFKSTDAGANWASVSTGMLGFTGRETHVNALVIDPSTPSTLYAGTSHAGAFKSVNGGGSWTSIDAGLYGPRVESLVMDPSAPATLYAAIFGGGIFKTTNGGGSWDPIFTGLTTPLVQALAVNPLAPATLYAGAYGVGGVFKSTDRGDKWKPVNGGLTNRAVRALAVDPAAPDTLFAGGEGGLFKSTDGADSWTSPSAYFTYQEVTGLLVDPSAPATVFVCGFATNSWGDESSAVFKSTDGGVNWKETPLPVWTLARDPSTPGTLYAGGFGVFRSSDRGETWTRINADLSSVVALAVDPSAPGTLYAATYDQGVFKTTNGGESWVPLRGGLAATARVFSLLIDPSHPMTVYAGGFKSTDGGNRWSALNNVPSDPRGNTSIEPIAMDPSTPTTLYARTSSGVSRSVDGGDSWTPINTGLDGAYVNALSVDPVTHKVFAATQTGVYEYLDRSCASNSTTLCLDGGRFQVTSQWTTAAGQSGPGRAVALAGGDTGYFTFFHPDNVEVMVKVLNAIGFQRGFWVFAGGLSDVGVVLTVTDTQTGGVKSYTNPAGTPFRPIQDMTSFTTPYIPEDPFGKESESGRRPTPPTEDVTVPREASATGPCVADGTTLCLGDSRFEVRVEWSGGGLRGPGRVIPLTRDTGAFWFFGPGNVEVVVKVLNGCGVNSRFWTFAGGLTDVNVILTVTDRQTGVVRTYTNPRGTPFEPIQDTTAFTACP